VIKRGIEIMGGKKKRQSHLLDPAFKLIYLSKR